MDPPFKSTESSPIQSVAGLRERREKEKAANDLQTMGIASLLPSYGFDVTAPSDLTGPITHERNPQLMPSSLFASLWRLKSNTLEIAAGLARPKSFASSLKYSSASLSVRTPSFVKPKRASR